MQELLGRPVADALVSQLLSRVHVLAAQGVTPTLAMVRVGERSDDLAYERAAVRQCERAGIAVRSFALPGDCGQHALADVIAKINRDRAIHGCLLFRPLSAHLNEAAVCAMLDGAKDVDGITSDSLYGVFAAQPIGFAPCTAEAVIELLDHYGYELSGAHVVVIGRSLVIGRPVSMLLQARNATVTMCHTRTRDLAALCRQADVLVAAAGCAGVVGGDAVVPGQVVVDAGINWDDATGTLCGDVAYDEVVRIVGAITPVPRGVGAVTTAVLASHVVKAAERACGNPSTL